MLSYVGSVVATLLVVAPARAGGVLDNDTHAVLVPVSLPAAELIAASLAEDTGPVGDVRSSLASRSAIRSRDEAPSRDGGDVISGGMVGLP